MSSYIPIASQTLGSSASSVTFSSIPTTLNGKTLRDLVLVCRLQITGTQAANLRFNAGTNNYQYVTARGNGSTAASYSASSQSAINLHFNDSGIGNNPIFTIQIFDFAQTNKHKSVLARHDDAGTVTRMTAGRWGNTSAITSVLFSSFGGTYNAGSTFSLYGIEG